MAILAGEIAQKLMTLPRPRYPLLWYRSGISCVPIQAVRYYRTNPSLSAGKTERTRSLAQHRVVSARRLCVGY